VPSGRRFPSNNHNRLWRFCSQIFTEPLYKSADDGPHPCDGGHDGFRATGAGNACASGTTTCWPRSADGSSTQMLGRPPRGSMQPRKYARLPRRGVCMGTAGWRCLGALSRRLAPCFPNRLGLGPGPANDGSGFCVRYCTTVLQPSMQTFGIESSQGISRRPRMRAAALMSFGRCLGL